MNWWTSLLFGVSLWAGGFGIGVFVETERSRRRTERYLREDRDMIDQESFDRWEEELGR